MRGRLEVEVDRAVVAAGEQGVDHPERTAHVAGAEAQVLVVLRAVLAVEVDVEELALPQRLGVAGGGVEAGHLLVPDLGVDADQLGPVEGLDERQRVADGRQQDVAARLVGLGLDREPQVVALVDDVLAEEVERLLVAVERGRDVLRRRRTRRPRGRPSRRRPWRRARRRGRCCASPCGSRSGARRGRCCVKPPSLKTGWVNRLVVAVVTARPVSARPFLKRSMIRVAGRRRRCRTGSGRRRGSSRRTRRCRRAAPGRRPGPSAARVASPNGSRACQPTVQRPKENLSSGVGVGMSMVIAASLSVWSGAVRSRSAA